MTCADLPGYLKNKVDDIRLIYTEYERFLSGGLKDSADRLTALMQAIPYSPLVADSHFTSRISIISPNRKPRSFLSL